MQGMKGIIGKEADALDADEHFDVM